MNRNPEYYKDLSYEYTAERLERLSEKTGRNIDMSTDKTGWLFKNFTYRVTIDDKVMFEDCNFHSIAKYVKGLYDSTRIRKEET